MSPPPFRAYAGTWLILGLLFGGLAWWLWRRPWIAVTAGVGLGFAGLVALVAVGGGRTPEPGRRGPDDPRR